MPKYDEWNSAIAADVCERALESLVYLDTTEERIEEIGRSRFSLASGTAGLPEGYKATVAGDDLLVTSADSASFTLVGATYATAGAYTFATGTNSASVAIDTGETGTAGKVWRVTFVDSASGGLSGSGSYTWTGSEIGRAHV